MRYVLPTALFLYYIGENKDEAHIPQCQFSLHGCRQHLVICFSDVDTHSLMRKDLTGHIWPDGHLHMPIIKLKKDKQNKHAKFMVTLPHDRQQHI